MTYPTTRWRRWKALVAVGVVGSVLLVSYFWRNQDDGLNWLRKYGPEEHVSVVSDSQGHQWRQHRFEFVLVPEELKPHLMKFLEESRAGNQWDAQMAPGIIIISRRLN